MPGDGVHIASLGQNIRVEIAQVTSFGSSLSRASLRDVTGLIEKLSWSYHRIGGCGKFEAVLVGYIDVSNYISDGYEIIIRVGTQAGDLDVFYRGKIQTIADRRSGDQRKTILRGMGLVSELLDTHIVQNYTDTVANIVSDIIQNYVAIEGRVTWNAAKIGAATYSATGLSFNHTALKAIKYLAELQGNIEWGVDEDGDFYFKPKSSAITNQNHIFDIRNNLFDIEDGETSRFDYNSLVVEGHTGFIYTYTNTSDSASRGLKQKVILASPFTLNADIDRWASNMVNLSINGESYVKTKLTNIKSRIEDAIPITQFKLIEEDGVQSTFDLFSVLYSIGATKTGAKTQDATRPRSNTLFNVLDLEATLQLGRPARDMIDELESLSNDILNLRKTNASGGAPYFFRQVGTGSCPSERWHFSNHWISGDISGSDLISNQGLYAFPYPEGRGGILDRIAVYVSTAPGSGNFRLGIYKAKSNTDIYPGDLVVDSGDLSGVGTGVKIATIEQILDTNTLYFLAILNKTGSNISITAHVSANLAVLWGSNDPTSPGGSSNIGFVKTGVTDTSLPDPFPTGAAFDTDTTPGIIFVRYSR